MDHYAVFHFNGFNPHFRFLKTIVVVVTAYLFVRYWYCVCTVGVFHHEWSITSLCIFQF